MEIQTRQVDYGITLSDIDYGLPFREYVKPGDTAKFHSVYMKCYNGFTNEVSNKTFVIDFRDGYVVNMPEQTKVIVIDAIITENVVKGTKK